MRHRTAHPVHSAYSMKKGLVIKNTGSWYLVKTDDGEMVECKIKGNFRLKGIRSTNPIAVGDRVQIAPNTEGTAFIAEIEDRKTISSDAPPIYPNNHTSLQLIWTSACWWLRSTIRKPLPFH